MNLHRGPLGQRAVDWIPTLITGYTLAIESESPGREVESVRTRSTAGTGWEKQEVLRVPHGESGIAYPQKVNTLTYSRGPNGRGSTGSDPQGYLFHQ